jgi:PhnB protein
MTFYKECLGGELKFQTNGESPFADKMPKKMKDVILHSTLIADNLVIMGSDMVPEPGLIKGNAITLALRCSTEEEIRNYYQKLSRGGRITQPLKNNHWGFLVGELTDKFGIHWLLSTPTNPQSGK